MNDIVKIKSPGLPTVGPTFNGLWAASRTYRQIDRSRYRISHHPTSVAFAADVRNKRLPLRLLPAVDAAEYEIYCALQRDDDWQGGVASLVMLYRSLGVKPADIDDLVKGALTALLNDDMGKIGGWEPVNATPSIVAISVRRLLMKSIFKPKPAELVKVCREVRLNLQSALSTCSGWRHDLFAADAVLLQFAHDEWERPYRLPEYRPALELVLERHECAQVVNAAYKGSFQKCVEREKNRFLISYDEDDEIEQIQESKHD